MSAPPPEPPPSVPLPRPRPPRPYADAPRLPELPAGERLDPRALVQGDWLEVEVGPGRGGFLFERAAAEPRGALLGLEVRRKWATIVDRRLAHQGLGARARVFAEDAKDALPRFGPEAIVRRFFVHFPDPWWKKRHHKRLVVGGLLLDEVARLLEPQGELFMQTDVDERALQYEAEVRALPRLFAPAGDPAADGSPTPWLRENPYSARSPREHRAIADGLPVHRLRFVRTADRG